MAVHRLLTVLFVGLAMAMATGVDGEYTGGGVVGAAPELGEAGSPTEPLPSGDSDTDTAPADEEGDDHTAIDDAVIDEKIKTPTFWKLCDFKGTQVAIDTSVADVGEVGISPNDVSSFKVPMGYLVTICADKSFEGTCKVFEPGSIHCLVNYDMDGGRSWDDQIESIKIQTSKIAEFNPESPPTGAEAEKAMEGRAKESSNKKEEELQVEKNAKTKLKLTQEQLLADRKKKEDAERATKAESSSEAKMKISKKTRSSAEEQEETAKTNYENAMKNEELAEKSREGDSKQATARNHQLEMSAAKESSAKTAATHARGLQERAQAKAEEGKEQFTKAGPERRGEMKSIADKLERGVRALKVRERQEKANLQKVDAAKEGVEKAVEFAKEKQEKSTGKLAKMKTIVDEKKSAETEKNMELDKAVDHAKEAAKMEIDNKEHEKRMKTADKNAQMEAEGRDKAAERVRKVRVLKEKTSKKTRLKVSFQAKKAKRLAEKQTKDEANQKFNKQKEEVSMKEVSTKKELHAEVLKKANVGERVDKLSMLRGQISDAQNTADEAEKLHEVAMKTVDNQRKRRAEQEEEQAQKIIKQRKEDQKVAANKEVIVKGKLAESARRVAMAEEQKREFADKAERVKALKEKTQEEREKRSNALEGKNKNEAKEALVAEELATKAKQAADDKLTKEDDKELTMKRAFEQSEKQIVKVKRDRDDLSRTHEVLNGDERLLKQDFQESVTKNKKIEFKVEVKVKEFEKRTKASDETNKKSQTKSDDLKRAEKQKEKQSANLEKRREQLDDKKENAEKTKVKAVEKSKKEEVKKNQVVSLLDTVAEATRTAQSTWMAQDSENNDAVAKIEKAKAEDKPAEVRDTLKEEEKAVKKKLDKTKKTHAKLQGAVKERTGKKTRAEKELVKLRNEAENAEKLKEKRGKKEKVLNDDMDAFKERGTKDKTAETQVKKDASEKGQKKDTFGRQEAKIKEEELGIKKIKEKREKVRNEKNDEKSEIVKKQEKVAVELTAVEGETREHENKVSRAKEERSTARTKEVEKTNKASKQLQIDLRRKVNSLKAVTEKHTKTTLDHFNRKLEKWNNEVKIEEEFAASSEKDKLAKGELVVSSTKKVAEQSKIISDSEDELQTARDELSEATSEEKKNMANIKVKELTKKFQDKLEAQSKVVNEKANTVLEQERSTKQERKHKDRLQMLMKKQMLWDKAVRTIKNYNKEKIHKREELDEKEAESKHNARERVEKVKLAAHAENFEKYRAKEAVEKINAARTGEKEAVRKREKSLSKEYASKKAIDEKKRKEAAKAVADAVDKKQEAFAAVKESFMKKSQTQANVLMMHEEKGRKINRKYDDANELYKKNARKANVAKLEMGAAEKNLIDAQQILESTKSPEAKKHAQGQYSTARGDKDAKKQKYDVAAELTSKAKGKVDEQQMVKDAEDKKVAEVKEVKSKTDERMHKAADACAAAKRASTGPQEKLKDMQAKAKDWAIRVKAHKEQAKKKEAALNIWDDLEKAKANYDKAAGSNPAFATGEVDMSKMTPEQKAAHLEAKRKAEQEGSATELAKEILGTKTGMPTPEKKKPILSITAEDQNHPLLKYAKEQRIKCKEKGPLPSKEATELCQKAAGAAIHFHKLKVAGKDPLAPDNLNKWQDRVGSELDNYDRLVEKLPLENGQKPDEEAKKKEEAPAGEEEEEEEEAEEDAESKDEVKPETLPDLPPSPPKSEVEAVLLEVSEESCDTLAGCQRSTKDVKKNLLAATADSEKCDKSDAKLTARLADQTKTQSSVERELSKSKTMLDSMVGSTEHVELGEAADMAADAAIESARAEIAAHKVAQRPHRPEELQHAVARATKAKHAQVMAELRVTQAATLA